MDTNGRKKWEKVQEQITARGRGAEAAEEGEAERNGLSWRGLGEGGGREREREGERDGLGWREWFGD